VTYSYDPALVLEDGPGLDPVWEQLRTIYVERAPHFLTTALPGLDPEKVTYVPHHVAHAASAALAAPPAADGRRDRAVFVADGRGETTSHLAGSYSEDGHLNVLAHQPLPESLGLVYEELTQHLGFRRSSDEYKGRALASYGEPAMSELLKDRIAYQGDGLIVASDVDWDSFVPPKQPGQEHTRLHADLAASVQHRTEEVLLEVLRWLYEQTGQRRLEMAGGVALNCVANSRIVREGPFEDVWIQPAAGDAGTALGGALQSAADLGDRIEPMVGADLGRGWDEEGLAAFLTEADVEYERPDDIAAEVARALHEDALVAWFQGRSEYGPRGTVPFWQIPPDGTTWKGSTGSRDVNNSAPWHRWSLPNAHPRSSPGARFPAPTCSSCTRWRRNGKSGYRPRCTWTEPLGYRPSPPRTTRSPLACSPSSRTCPGCPCW